ncbi:MAG: LysR family transcriptional regulator [Pseudomonadales bacterium]
MRFERGELQVLAQVIASGGFQRAADAMGLSQSAVSQAVAGLENKVGTSLIHRGRTPTLTRVGRRVFDYAEQLLVAEQQLILDVGHLRKGLQPPLSLAINNFVSHYFAADLLASCADGAADMVLNARVLPSRQIISAVLNDQVELGFGPFQTDMAAFEQVPLLSVRHSLVIGDCHPDYAAIMAGDERRLAGSRLIASYLDEPEQRPGQERIRDFFASAWQVNSLALRLQLLQRGLGVGFVNRPMLLDQTSGSANERRLAEIETSHFPSFERSLGIYYKKNSVLTPTANQFLQLCRQRWL